MTKRASKARGTCVKIAAQTIGIKFQLPSQNCYQRDGAQLQLLKQHEIQELVPSKAGEAYVRIPKSLSYLFPQQGFSLNKPSPKNQSLGKTRNFLPAIMIFPISEACGGGRFWWLSCGGVNCGAAHLDPVDSGETCTLHSWHSADMKFYLGDIKSISIAL